MSEGKILGAREVDQDDFKNYRQKYPGPRNSKNTWKYRVESYAKAFPKRPCMIQGDRQQSWSEFNARCNRVAHGMAGLGLKKEDRVAIVGYNTIEWMEAFFGSSKIGAVPANVNPRFVPDEVRYVIEDCDAKIAFVEEPYAEMVAGIRSQLPLLEHVVVYNGGKRPEIVPDGMLVYDDFLSLDESNPDVQVYNDDFAMLIYTGGTTGYPKGTIWDGEMRVRGLDMMLINNIVPIFDKLADYPEDAIKGIASLLMSSPAGIKVTTKVLSSRVSRAILRSSLTKNMVLMTFKWMAGQASHLKLMTMLQKDGVRFLCGAPLFHGAGIEGAFTYIGAIAATTVFLPTPHPFIAKEWLEAVEQHKVHTTVIVGDAFSLPLVEQLRKDKAEGKTYKLKSLWAIVSSGVRWSPHIKQEFLDFMPGTLLIDTMGTSESSGAFASITASSDDEIKAAGAHLITDKSGFYKKQVFGCRVVNPETGKDVVPGTDEIGEFLFGGWMTLGYWKCPKKTAHDFRILDGQRWFFVGDEGTVSENGRFNLIGRGGGYMINSGGEKVYSEEVEEIVKGHPKVWDCAVVGIPDPRWGQAVTALVELEPGVEATAEELIEYTKEKMAGYKRPRNIFFIDKVPRAAAGKVDRTLAIALVGEQLKEEARDQA
ncbi:MAG: AMP-binding protein [Candidatus Geothermincolia bacterium]